MIDLPHKFKFVDTGILVEYNNNETYHSYISGCYVEMSSYTVRAMMEAGLLKELSPSKGDIVRALEEIVSKTDHHNSQRDRIATFIMFDPELSKLFMKRYKDWAS